MIFGRVHLKVDIDPCNYYTYLYHNVNLILILVSVETLKVMLLTSKSHYNLPLNQAATTVANILLFETIFRIIISPLLGALNDIIGRK